MTWAPSNHPSSSPPRQILGRWLLLLWLSLSSGLAVAGCNPPPTGQGSGAGPGGRAQELALTPEQEIALGERAYREILSKSKVVPSGSDVDRVRRVGKKIEQAAEIEPLQREINLRIRAKFQWKFTVLDDRQINAFCLPGGKVFVFMGLLPVAATDAQLATVIAHEVTHALAHHTSERLGLKIPAKIAVASNVSSSQTSSRLSKARSSIGRKKNAGLRSPSPTRLGKTKSRQQSGLTTRPKNVQNDWMMKTAPPADLPSESPRCENFALTIPRMSLATFGSDNC